MKSGRFRRGAMLALWALAAAAYANAQVTFQTDPASLDFGSTTASKTVHVTTSTGAQAVTTVNCPAGLSCVPVDAASFITPFDLKVTPTSTVGSINSAITLTAVGVTPASIQVTANYGTGGSGGTAAFAVTPAVMAFQDGGTLYTSITSNTGTAPTYVPTLTYTSANTGWLTVYPTSGIASNSMFVQVTANGTGLPQGIYYANLVLTPTSVAAPAVTIPISLTVGTSTGTGSFVVSPNPITFTYAAGTTAAQYANVAVTGPSTPVPYTASILGDAAFYVTAPLSGTTGAFLQLTLANPQIVPAGITGTLRLTPTVAGYTATDIPIQINGSGSAFGAFNVSASSLSFAGTLGTGQAVAPQTLFVQSVNSSQPNVYFSATATSTNNFLNVSPNAGVTPGTLTVSVNLSAITAPGTYSGTITLTPFNSQSPQTIPVTLTVTGITTDPASVSLSAPSGGAAVQQTVSLAGAAGTPFAASASITSGATNWLTVQASAATLPGSLTISANPSGLAAGTYQGTVSLSSNGAPAGTIPVTLTVTVAGTLQLSPASLTFNYQTTSSAAPPAQTIQVASAGAQGLTWNAVTASGGNWLQVNPTTGSTPGSASVTIVPTGLQAGTYTGTIKVSSSGATNSPQTIPVTLNVTTPAIPQILSLVNAASYGPTQAVPGLIVTLFGKDLGPANLATAQVSGGQVATTLGGTRVLFDGVPAPIIYTSATQLAVVVPYEIAGRFSTRVQVEYNGQTSGVIELRVADTAPALFTLNNQGTGQAAVLNQDYAPNVAGNPETRGRVITLYATGEGQTNPQGQTGRVIQPVASDLRRPVAPVIVRFGDQPGVPGVPGVVEYAGSAPGFVAGALQVNVRIPANAPTGPNVPVTLQIGSAASQTGVTVAIK